MKTNKKNNSTGFTLLETIVAVSILVTAIIGPFSLASQSINAQGKAKNNLIAANLAQEGLELFRNYRANNILRFDPTLDFNTEIGPHWLDGAGDESTGDACWSVAGCGIDALTYVQAPSLPPCGAINNCALYFDVNNVYGHNSSGVSTKFRRKINLERISANPPEIKVTATVIWDEAFGSSQLSVSTHLMNW